MTMKEKAITLNKLVNIVPMQRFNKTGKVKSTDQSKTLRTVNKVLDEWEGMVNRQRNAPRRAEGCQIFATEN